MEPEMENFSGAIKLRAAMGELLPVDVLVQVFLHLGSFNDLANAGRVCKQWRECVRQAMASRNSFDFFGYCVTDDVIARLVADAWCLRRIYLGLHCITNKGLHEISMAKCCPQLISISLIGVDDTTEEGVVELLSKATSLQYLFLVGGSILNAHMKTIAVHCPHLKMKMRGLNSRCED